MNLSSHDSLGIQKQQPVRAQVTRWARTQSLVTESDSETPTCEISVFINTLFVCICMYHAIICIYMSVILSISFFCVFICLSMKNMSDKPLPPAGIFWCPSPMHVRQKKSLLSCACDHAGVFSTWHKLCYI